MALQKFKEFIRDRQRPVSRRLEMKVIEEQTDDQYITDAATVIIGSELSASETEASDGQSSNWIRKMSERGNTIIATAVGIGVKAEKGISMKKYRIEKIDGSKNSCIHFESASIWRK